MTAPTDPAMTHCGQCPHRLGSGCGEPCCTWADDAVQAGVRAIRSLYPDDLLFDDLLTRDVREVVQAALPVIAAAVAAGERERMAAAYGQGRDDEADDLPIPAWVETAEHGWRADRDKLAAIRTLAESLGDRSGEPRETARPSDRRLMEPLRRMLLGILDGTRADLLRAPGAAAVTAHEGDTCE